MDLLKLVEVGPGVAKVGLHLHGAHEPLAGLLDFPLGPHQFGAGQQHIGVVLALLQGVHNFGFARMPLLHEDCFGPEAS